jgi:hypothetical protein
MPCPDLMALCLLEAQTKESLVNPKDFWYNHCDRKVLLDLSFFELVFLLEVHAVVISVVPDVEPVLELEPEDSRSLTFNSFSILSSRSPSGRNGFSRSSRNYTNYL